MTEIKGDSARQLSLLRAEEYREHGARPGQPASTLFPKRHRPARGRAANGSDESQTGTHGLSGVNFVNATSVLP
jgi:hypothetical protein